MRAQRRAEDAEKGGVLMESELHRDLSRISVWCLVALFLLAAHALVIFIQFQREYREIYSHLSMTLPLYTVIALGPLPFVMLAGCPLLGVVVQCVAKNRMNVIAAHLALLVVVSGILGIFLRALHHPFANLPTDVLGR